MNNFHPCFKITTYWSEMFAIHYDPVPGQKPDKSKAVLHGFDFIHFYDSLAMNGFTNPCGISYPSGNAYKVYSRINYPHQVTNIIS